MEKSVVDRVGLRIGCFLHLRGQKRPTHTHREREREREKHYLSCNAVNRLEDLIASLVCWFRGEGGATCLSYSSHCKGIVTRR